MYQLGSTSPLNKYAIITNAGIVGGGTVNIQNGNYGAVQPGTVNQVTLNSYGNPYGENTTDLVSATSQLQGIGGYLLSKPPINLQTYLGSATSIFTIYPGHYLLYDPAFPERKDTLPIPDNAIITFDARNDSNALFMIDTRSIVFGNNVTIRLLNGAKHTNVYWFAFDTTQADPTQSAITFKGTNTQMFGIFYSYNIIVENNLTISGLISAETTLIVRGTLTINTQLNPVSDICFAKNTPIETDQGIVMIQDLKPDVHTIRKEPIVAITRTLSLDNFLICFEKHTFERNCPSERTIVSKDHKIWYKDKMVSAYKLMLPRFENFVHKIPYDGQPLYNILMKNHGTVRANNLVCETLDPKSIIGVLYANNIITDKHVLSINAFSFQKHKDTKKNEFKRFLYKM